MSGTSTTSVIVRGLAGELRELRREKGLSLRSVSAQLGWVPSKLSRLENGHQKLHSTDVASLLTIYSVTGIDRKRMLAMAERSQDVGWWDTFGPELTAISKMHIRLERQATSISTWQPLLIPGLLQTPEYTRIIMEGRGLSVNSTEVRVAARVARQGILSKKGAPKFAVLIDEAVLRRPIGGEAVIARQRRRLVEATENPNVTIQVVPLSRQEPRGLAGAFNILDFARNRSLVHLEPRLTGLYLEESWQLEDYRATFDTLRKIALSPTDSVNFIASISSL